MISEHIIKPNDRVIVTKMNHIVEIQHMEKMNTSNKITKLCKDTYRVNDTGEIKDFIHSETRQDNENSIRQTMKKLRYLINNNFTGKENELHITLTYKENMQDLRRLYKDFDRFMKRLKYKLRKRTKIEYISVVEPQGRGAWHCHVLIRFEDIDRAFILNKEVSDLWGNGFVTVNRIEEVDNIGAYLTAYLTDMELPKESDRDDDKVVKKVVDGKEKRFVKGARLVFYPVGMKIYRSSRGIRPPEREKMRYKDSKKITGYGTPRYSSSYDVEVDGFENTITFHEYNLIDSYRNRILQEGKSVKERCLDKEK